MHNELQQAIGVLQRAMTAASQPEPARDVAERMLDVINKNLKLEGRPVIKCYDALYNIRDDLTRIIEADRAGRIAAEFDKADPNDAAFGKYG